MYVVTSLDLPHISVVSSRLSRVRTLLPSHGSFDSEMILSDSFLANTSGGRGPGFGVFCLPSIKPWSSETATPLRVVLKVLFEGGTRGNTGPS